MKIPNDPDKIDQELNDKNNDGNQIFKSKNQKSPFDSNNRPKKPNNEPENHLKSWIIAGVACLVVFIGGFMMTHHRSSSTAKPAKTEQVAKKKSIKSEKPKQSVEKKKTVNQQSKKDNNQDKSMTDPKPNINNLFNAMYVYDYAKTSPHDQAEAMLKVSNENVVNALMPGSLGKTGKAGFEAKGSMYKPISIIKNPVDDKTYDVTVYAKVESNGHESKVANKFTVIANKDGKIDKVNPRESTLDD